MNAVSESRAERLTRLEIEDALMEVKGDMLLLTLAIDVVEEAGNDARKGEPAREVLELQLHEEQISAITHAHVHLIASIKELSRRFYGEDMPA